MKRTLLEAQNPQWNNAEQTSFDIEVKFAEIVYNGDPVFIPFTASPNDPEPHGQDIWARGIAGEWGEIAAYEES